MPSQRIKIRCYKIGRSYGTVYKLIDAFAQSEGINIK